MEQFNISLELANKILAYLGSKPYSEVETLIADIRVAFSNSQTTSAAEKKDKK
jgi:hypothetical protein